MEPHLSHPTTPVSPPGPLRVAALAAALLAAALFGAACGSGGPKSPGVAGAGSSTTASSQSGSPKASALAYSRCMRAHGITDFPDPNSQGDIQLDAGPGSDLVGPRFDAADTACKALRPSQGAPPAGLKAANLKYSRCMRQNGISDFPDPSADGSLQVQVAPGGDLDPKNPQNKRADNACKKYKLDGGGGSSLSSSGG